MLTTYPHAQPDPSNVARFGRFRSISLQFDDCTASSRALTAFKRGELHYTRVRHADDTPTEGFM